MFQHRQEWFRRQTNTSRSVNGRSSVKKGIKIAMDEIAFVHKANNGLKGGTWGTRFFGCGQKHHTEEA